MTERPKKAYCRLNLSCGKIDLHYRMLGRGPALLMLHPSPLSSAFMAPLMQRFAGRALTIAPDTPGYGRSTAIAGEIKDLTPYVEAMRRFIDALGLTQYAIYGSATGAQIAIELAKRDADRVTGVILDNAADFTDAESEHIMQGYFPDTTPCEDGSHLARIWQVAHDSTLFFPWHLRRAENRIAPAPAAAEIMHMTAMGYLQAGPAYDQAYRAAFRNERAARVQGISVPVSIIRWPSSILKRYTDRFDDYAWGEQVHMAHCDAGMEARVQCIEAQFPRIFAGGAQARPLTVAESQFGYVDTSFGQVRYARRGEQTSRILLHAPGESIDSLSAESADAAHNAQADRLLIDLPGHGESDCPQSTDAQTYLDACAESVQRVAEAFALPKSAIQGQGISAILAARLGGEQGSARSVESVQDDIDMSAPPCLTPEPCGAHLWRGWYYLRRRSQHSQELDTMCPTPEALTRRLFDLNVSQSAHRHLHTLWEGTP